MSSGQSLFVSSTTAIADTTWAATDPARTTGDPSVRSACSLMLFRRAPSSEIHRCEMTL